MKYPYYIWPSDTLEWDSCAGDNKKKTLVVATASSGNENLALLKKILRAVDLDFDTDIHFIQTSDHLETQLLCDNRMPEYHRLICFGLRPSQIGLKTNDTHSGCRMYQFEKLICISAPTLQDIETQPQCKKELWNILKFVFQNEN